MRHPARRGDRLDLVGFFQGLEAIPKPGASAEQNWYHRDVRMVDESGGKKVADDGRTSPDAHAQAVRGFACRLEGLCGRGVNEVERRAAARRRSSDWWLDSELDGRTPHNM